MATQVPLKIYKSWVGDHWNYSILPGYNTPYGSQETTAADYVQNASTQNKQDNLSDLKIGFGLPVSSIENVLANMTNSGYVIDDQGRFIQQSSLDQESQLKNDPNMVNIGTPDRPLYVPKGSAGEQNLPNIGTNNTANQQQPPTAGSAGGGTGTGGGGMVAGVTTDPLAEVYARRPDLQAVYNPDGSRKDPNNGDHPATLQEWAQRFGVSEEPTLKNYVPGQSGGSAIGGTGFPSTGNPELDAILQRLDKMIQDQAAAGKKFNPNIELNAETVQKFLDQATSEIEPYYANQIKVIKDDLVRNLQASQQMYESQQDQREAEFKKTLSGNREQAAGAGLTFSGVRGAEEKALVDNTNRELNFAAVSAANNAANTFSGAEKTVGSRSLADLGFPGISNFQASTDGDGGFARGDNVPYAAPRDVTGSLEYAKRGDIRSLTDFLKQQEIQKRSLSFTG